MIKDISAERIATSLKMNSGFKGTYLLVEGQRDSSLLTKFINKTECQIELTFGRNNLVNAIKILNQENFSRVLAIADRDFDDIIKFEITEDNLLITDYHDIEISLIESSALDSVIDCYCSIEKTKKIIDNQKKSIREILYELIYDLGILKLANKIHALGLVFKPSAPDGKPITYSDFIDFSKMERGQSDNLIKSIHNYSNNKGTKLESIETVKVKFEEIKNGGPYDKLHISNGHDLTFTLQLALKKSIGSKLGTESSPKAIEISLILAFDSKEFEKTQLYKNIKLWEKEKSRIVLAI